MKKTVVIAIAALMCLSFILSGCKSNYDKSPDQYKKIRWITSDYAFKIYPDNGCKGTYKFNDKKYNIQAKFVSDAITVYDTDKKNTELFNGNWMYEKGELVVYAVTFNSKDYKEFETNYGDYVKLHKEKVK